MLCVQVGLIDGVKLGERAGVLVALGTGLGLRVGVGLALGEFAGLAERDGLAVGLAVRLGV
jgi:hypothetical protein